MNADHTSLSPDDSLPGSATVTPVMKPVSSKPDFIGMEHQVIKLWKELNLLERVREKNAANPPFRFVDGPITANNPMGVHHAWGRTLKDVYIRFHTRNGHSCRFQNGFDCQGLWVEVEVEKSLGFSGKPDIERFGLDRFAQACKERIGQFSSVITEQSERLGQLMDWDHSYYTHTDGNILGIWHFLKQCADRGWLYRKHLPMPWCPRCGTSLSEHEMSGSYKELSHLSIYAHVPLLDQPDVHLLLWTTTPWTLPANVAAAVNPALDYVLVSSPRWTFKLILGKDTLQVLREFPHQVERTFKGAELVGQRYQTFFSELEVQQGFVHRVVAWDDVSATEGTGIVHNAPGCGREDFELGQREGLGAISPVDESGHFVRGFGPLTGRHAAEVGPEVSALLEASGKLLKTELYTHSYPICWRCKGELIFRLVGEWFISCEEIRPLMIAAARTVSWKPDFMGKRMEDWLNNMGDWCISRKRFWGLPLPFYVCGDCQHVQVVGSREELRARALDPSRVDALPELHRPWIDEVQIRCEQCGATVSRVVEVGDCWLDAGIVPYSTQGFFEDRVTWEQHFPVQWVCEMREQVRLWFYSLLFMGVTISGRAPYEQVLAYERVISEEGTKFSKTGYMIRFDEAVEKMGADVMRYLFCNQPVANELRFGYGIGEIVWRKLAGLWNVYAFFVTYAVIDAPSGLEHIENDGLQLTDRWLRARTQRMVSTATQGYREQNTFAILQEFEDYIDDVSNWYVRVSRRRFWKAGDPEDKQAGYASLYQSLKSVAMVLSPIVPFMTEEIWQNLVRPMEPGEAVSIHCADWPSLPASWQDDALLEATRWVRKAISLALELREQASLRVRQPLPTLYLVAQGEIRDALREQLPLIQSELNVKLVVVVDDASSLREGRLALNFKAAGPVLRKDVNRVKELLETLDPTTHSQLVARFDAGETLLIPGYEADVPPMVFVKQELTRSGFKEASDGPLTVALDTSLTPELVREGLVRDLVRNLQVLRRDSGLEISQRIELGLELGGMELRTAVEEHRAYVLEEVLATSLVEHSLAEPNFTGEYEILGSPVRATLRPVDVPTQVLISGSAQ